MEKDFNLLGIDPILKIPYFAIEVVQEKIDFFFFNSIISKIPTSIQSFQLLENENFFNLRFAATRLEDVEASIVAQGLHIIEWHKTHSFCSNCGNITIRTFGGSRRKCNYCSTEHFPRVDPAGSF